MKDYSRGVLLWLIASICSMDVHPKEEEVLVLTDHTIDEVIDRYTNLVILFYAPWCPHCILLEPEYAQAALHFRRNASIPIKFAKVDITANPETRDKYSIRGLPSVKWLSTGTTSDFFGGRTKEKMIKWTMMKLYSALTTLSTIIEVERLEDSSEISLVYFGDNKEDLKLLEAYALEGDQNDYYVYSAKEKNKYNAADRTLVLFKPFDERLASLKPPFSNETIAQFVIVNSYPTVIEDIKTAVEYVTMNKDPMIFLIRSPSDTKHDAAFKKVAKRRKEDIQSVIASSKGETEEAIFTALKVDLKAIPQVLIVQHGKRKMSTFNITSNISEETIEKFINDYFRGTLKEDKVSEEIPAEQKDAVFKLVGKSFNKEVIENDMDVLVKFYQPWCGHCKSLAPIYEQLAKKLKNSKKLRIAELNMNVNDFDSYPIDSYPTILFYKGNNKFVPIPYEGERTVEAFEAFLKKESLHPIQQENTDL